MGRCKECDGELVFIGSLGNLMWFRCRACGAEVYKEIPSGIKDGPDGEIDTSSVVLG